VIDYDVIVLGGGSAGTSAAGAAGAAGARTAMINDGELGGLCILRGCMPTKSMLASAHAFHEAAHLEPFGGRLEGAVRIDFRRVMERKDALVARFKRAKIQEIDSGDYEVIDGRGRFAPGGGVVVGDRTWTARRYVIASGSTPVILPVPGLERVPVMTSDDAMRLKSRPDSLLVIGTGPIGLELAQFFARVGSRVRIICRSSILSRHDVENGHELHRALEDEPRLSITAPAVLEELRPTRTGLAARIRYGDKQEEYEADVLLMAVGREAALDDLGLEHVGLKPSAGRLDHDERMCTANPEIFVAGDATGSYQILHLANQEGNVAGTNAAIGPDSASALRMDYRLQMSVIFTDPPYAQIGLSESEAARRGIDFVVGRVRFPETGRAITMESRYGLWKLIAARATGEILGSSLLGPRADDLVHLVMLMMRYGGTVHDILDLPLYHPTVSEVLYNLARDIRAQIRPA